MAVPVRPKIYHIVHIDRLASIVADGHLWSDAEMNRRQPAGTTIGVGSIKQRRLRLPIACHEGGTVGGFVPFYFCPRSVMLFVIHCANHPELTYRGGQQPIVHLEADLHTCIDWAQSEPRRWAFSLSNAGAVYTEFRADVARLAAINWAAVTATDFRSADVKEAKQAEFLVEQSFPWRLVERIGVYSQSNVQAVSIALQGADHRPKIEIRRDWYF